MANNICERVLRFWKDHDRILPEIYQMNQDTIEEVIDGVDDSEKDLRQALVEAKECAAI